MKLPRVLKEKVNHFLTSVHCVAHMINLAAIDTIKIGPCKYMSRKINVILNLVVIYFKKSCKKKNTLFRLQEELADFTKCLKIYYKIRWLSRWQAVTTLYDYLENVLTYFRNNHDAMENEVGSNIFRKFCTFKYIYVFYFFANILHVLSMLSPLFQNKIVCIAIIGSVVNTNIVQIHMIFTEDTTDLNNETFNEQIGYHILP